MTAFADIHPDQVVQVRDEAHDGWRPRVQVLDGPYVCEEGCCWVLGLPEGSDFPRRLHASRSHEVRVVEPALPDPDAAYKAAIEDVNGDTE